MSSRILARRLVAAILLGGLWPGSVARAAPCWEPPVSAPVADPFRPPPCRWCPGNRGIEYATSHGERVVAVATGRVTYAGVIAGVVYVVVGLRDGRRVTYGNLIAARHRIGDVVVRGSSVGRTAGPLHIGLRDGDEYVDPAPLIGRWVHRPRLIPTDGNDGNPPGPQRLACRRS